MRNAQKNDPIVEALASQLARGTLKTLLIANQQHWNHHFHLHIWLRKLIKKISLEHIDRHKISTNSTLPSSINNLSMDIENRTMEQYVAYMISVIK